MHNLTEANWTALQKSGQMLIPPSKTDTVEIGLNSMHVEHSNDLREERRKFESHMREAERIASDEDPELGILKHSYEPCYMSSNVCKTS